MKFGDNVPRDRIIDSGRCGRLLVTESSVQYRPASSSTTAAAAAWIIDQILRLRVVLDGWCRRCATTVELSMTAGSAALVVGTLVRAVTLRTASRCWAVVRQSPSGARAVASSVS